MMNIEDDLVLRTFCCKHELFHMFQMRVISRVAIRRTVRQLQGICEHAVRDKGELVLGIQDRNQLQDA